MVEIIGVSGEERNVPFDGPALLANKFYITVGPTVRIAFAEQGSPDAIPNFRTAVSLAHSDAIQLADLLKDLLKDIEEQIKKLQAAESNAGHANG